MQSGMSLFAPLARCLCLFKSITVRRAHPAPPPIQDTYGSIQSYVRHLSNPIRRLLPRGSNFPPPGYLVDHLELLIITYLAVGAVPSGKNGTPPARPRDRLA